MKANARAVYRPITDLERARATALFKQCTYPTGSFSKRFARTIHGQALTGEITERQASRLAIQAYIYRRQMPSELVPVDPPHGYLTPKEREAEARLKSMKPTHEPAHACNTKPIETNLL